MLCFFWADGYFVAINFVVKINFFGSVIPAAPNQKYVFDSNLNFGSGINLESPSTQRLSLSDFDFAGVSTSAGINMAS